MLRLLMVKGEHDDRFHDFQILSDNIYAVSHGVFFEEMSELYLAVPYFRGLGEPVFTRDGEKLIRFPGLHMRVFRLVEERFEMTLEFLPDFWPLQPPQKMTGGALILRGCDSTWKSSVAVKAPGGKWSLSDMALSGRPYSECNVMVIEKDIVALMRNEGRVEKGTSPKCAAALSGDNGKTFAPAFETSFDMVASKVCAGKLDESHFCVVMNHKDVPPFDRSRLVLGVGHGLSENGEPIFDDLFVLDEDREETWICYPYGIVMGNDFWVVYSKQSAGVRKAIGKRMNLNDIRLAVVPLSSLIKENRNEK